MSANFAAVNGESNLDGETIEMKNVMSMDDNIENPKFTHVEAKSEEQSVDI